MPQPTALRFTTRGDEGDHRGLLSATRILNYMEHLRWEAVWRNLDGVADLFSDGRYGVVRAQHLRILRPLPVNTPVTFNVWLERVGRTSLTFGHQALDPHGEPFAAAAVVWVHLSGPNQPHPLPSTLRADPRGGLPELRRFDAEPPPPDAHLRRFTVRASEIDALGHLNHASYARFVEDTRIDLPDPFTLHTPITHLSLEYLAETHLHAEVQVQVWPDPADPRALHSLLTSGGRPIARAWLAV